MTAENAADRHLPTTDFFYYIVVLLLITLSPIWISLDYLFTILFRRSDKQRWDSCTDDTITTFANDPDSMDFKKIYLLLRAKEESRGASGERKKKNDDDGDKGTMDVYRAPAATITAKSLEAVARLSHIYKLEIDSYVEGNRSPEKAAPLFYRRRPHLPCAPHPPLSQVTCRFSPKPRTSRCFC